MRILWVSNAAFNKTGYGVATHAVTQQLIKDGHHVEVLAYWGLNGGEVEVAGVNHLPGRIDMWGNDAIEDYARRMNADFVLVHRDIWVNSVEVTRRVPTAAWFPMDQRPAVNVITERLAVTNWAATLSRFGQEECRKAGFDVEYIPHSVGAAYKYNRSRDARGTVLTNIPKDAFLVTMVAANKGFPSRKGFPEMFQAIAELQRRYDDVWFYAHTLHNNDQGGPDLQVLARLCGMDLTRGAFLHPMLYWNPIEDEQMAAVYAASDVLLATSYGEGFGIPILEAQACGTPVITTDATAMPEITWYGATVPGRPMLTALYGWMAIPDVNAIVEALERVRAAKDDPKAKAVGEETAKRIAELWSNEAHHERFWRPWLAQIEQDLKLLPPW